MAGKSVIFLWCACGRRGEVEARDEWNALLRDELLRLFRCSACGRRPSDLRRGWAVPSLGKAAPKD